MSAADIHPDLQKIARFLPRGAGPRGIAIARTVSPWFTRRVPPGVRVQHLGPVSVRLHTPTEPHPNGAALLWIHGGGYVLGSAAQDDPLCARLASQLGVTVAAVDYRLAPKHPYPAPLEDCYSALTWLAKQPGVDRTRVAIGGASAGGGLAAGLALLARDRDGVKPAFQLLIYPMLDDRTALRSDIDQGGFRLWNNRANAFGWRSYTGRHPGDGSVEIYAVPARSDDLSGLPPAWIGVGTQDLFHDEDTAYAERLRAAGVPCALEVVPGAFHGFDAVAPKTAVATAFREAVLAAVGAGLQVS
ncbi:MAG TPA: alpha/beta hydrolase [Mycobacteriales bacterium]|nr:alpha/beta hydrolase [Mycobacteriales bacterium]